MEIEDFERDDLSLESATVREDGDIYEIAKNQDYLDVTEDGEVELEYAVEKNHEVVRGVYANLEGTGFQTAPKKTVENILEKSPFNIYDEDSDLEELICYEPE